MLVGTSGAVGTLARLLGFGGAGLVMAGGSIVGGTVRPGFGAAPLDCTSPRDCTSIVVALLPGPRAGIPGGRPGTNGIASA